MPELTKLQKEDKEFIKQENWPNWPVLPLKRYNPEYEAGILLATEHTSVRLGNMFCLPENLDELKVINYPSTDALLQDGWQVD